MRIHSCFTRWLLDLSEKNNSNNDSIDGDGLTEDNTKVELDRIRKYLMRFLDFILGILIAEPTRLLPVIKMPLNKLVRKIIVPCGANNREA